MNSRMDQTFISSILDPRILTIGFARRFATYKRGSLMISDQIFETGMVLAQFG